MANSTDATTVDGKMATVAGGSPSDICAGEEGGKDSCQVKADFILYAVRFLFVFFLIL